MCGAVSSARAASTAAWNAGLDIGRSAPGLLPRRIPQSFPSRRPGNCVAMTIPEAGASTMPIVNKIIRTELTTAFRERRFKDVNAQYHSSAMSEAIRWFRRGGGQLRPTAGRADAGRVGLRPARAATEEVKERRRGGHRPRCPPLHGFGAAAELRLALEEPTEFRARPDIGRRSPRARGCGVYLGQMEGIMSAIRLGWLDKLAMFEVERTSGARATRRSMRRKPVRRNGGQRRRVPGSLARTPRSATET